MDNTTKLSQRRQTTNDILTGVNVCFLTGMGAAFVLSHLMSWWLTAVFGLLEPSFRSSDWPDWRTPIG
jgi:hypothetical protein